MKLNVTSRHVLAILVPLTLLAAASHSRAQAPADSPAIEPALQPGDVPPDQPLKAEPEPAIVPIVVDPAANPKPPTPAAPEAVSSPARDVLEACKRAVMASHTITFRARNYATDSLKAMSPDSQADVRMLKPAGMNSWIVRSTGSGSAKGEGKQLQFDVAWLTITTEFVDHDAKKVVEKRPREARSPFYQVAMGSKIEDIVSASPLAKPLGAAELTLDARTEMGGVECDVVRIATGVGGKNVTIWTIGVEDHFPRKIEKVVQSSAISGSIVTELSDVVLSADPGTIRAELMRVAIPEGYTEDRPVAAPSPVLVPGVTEAPKGTDAGQGEKGEAIPSATPSGEVTPAAVPMQNPAPPESALPLSLPEFELSDAAGTKVSNASLRGKPAVLVFFGAWSLPARQSLPSIQAAVQPHAASVTVFGVSV
ncbi:MAG: redoxin domain-containing protein, partial [bacterium]|nr:redoxin domain-containing protein [bacterium]